MRKSSYRCCWNCANGSIVCSTEQGTLQFNASKRLCSAPHPVSPHAENPYKQRSCKQFEPPVRGNVKLGHEISKGEADMLNGLTVTELVRYWFGV